MRQTARHSAIHRDKQHKSRISATNSKWNIPKTRFQFLQQVGAELRDLYSINQRDFAQKQAYTLLAKYHNSPALAVMVEYPDQAWKPWKFVKSSQGWWRQLGQLFRRGCPVAENVTRGYLEELNIDSSIDATSNLDALESTILLKYGQAALNRISQLGGLRFILSRLNPTHPATTGAFDFMQDFLFDPGTKFEIPSVRRKAMEVLQNGGHLENLYNATYTTFLKLNATNLVILYNGSAALACLCEFPEHPWKPWKFAKTPRQWWKSVAALFFQGDAVAETILRVFLEEVEQLADTLPTRDTGAERRLDYFGGLNELRKMLSSTQSTSVNNTAYLDISSSAGRRAFLEKLVRENNGDINTLYKITTRRLRKLRALQICTIYNGSASRAIMTEFPEYAWSPWKFNQTPRFWFSALMAQAKLGYAPAEACLRLLLDDIANNIGVCSLHDWMTANLSQHSRFYRILKRKDLEEALKCAYPDHDWSGFTKEHHADQRDLSEAVYAVLGTGYT